MSEWAAGGSIAHDRRSLVQEVLLLSLLYDRILIQDEALTLTSKLATWFITKPGRRVLEELLDAGTLVVLTHPRRGYPTEQLRDRSEFSPIQARAEFHQKYSTKGGKPFRPTEQQLEFYRLLDSLLQEYRAARRPVGQITNADPNVKYRAVLREILSQTKYHKWLCSAFRGFSKGVAAQFLRYVEDPLTAADTIRRTGAEPKITFDESGRALFSRSLGYQIADCYGERAAAAMKCIIQTAFAAPFCDNEDAAGLYGPKLRELILTSEECTEEALVRVRALVNTPLALPLSEFGFAQTIHDVRKTPSGRALRASVRKLGNLIDFSEQQSCWQAVSDEIAHRAHSVHKLTIRSIVAEIGRHVISGTFVAGLCESLGTYASAFSAVDLARLGLEHLAGAAMSIAGEQTYRMLQADLQRQQLRRALEQSVEFRCVEVPLPPVKMP
jgi:hypothetical protein